MHENLYVLLLKTPQSCESDSCGIGEEGGKLPLFPGPHPVPADESLIGRGVTTVLIGVNEAGKKWWNV